MSEVTEAVNRQLEASRRRLLRRVELGLAKIELTFNTSDKAGFAVGIRDFDLGKADSASPEEQ